MDKVSIHVKRAFLSKLLIVQICCLYVIGITAKTYANNVPTFTASAPDNIEVDTQFRLGFTVASTKELDDADLMGLSVSTPKSLTVLMGPTRAKVSQSRNIGGKIVSSHQVTYTYILSASQVGTFTIPTASITVKGKTLRSQPLVLTVVSAGKLSSGHAPQPQLDTFITMTVSERSPRVNAPVVLEYKLYTAVLADSLANMEQHISPDDFRVESVNLWGSQWQLEHRNGKNYHTVVFRKLLLYPLRMRELRIGDLYMDVYIRQHNLSSDPFGTFFEDSNHQLVKQRGNCQGITLYAHE